ncbi:MAG: LPS export ABC transporter periplasmic protein LptC [Myxococcota bacterium]|nr:LPS export ABC transporter periplasmic protein LptC [Myxococcota bacterium]
MLPVVAVLVVGVYGVGRADEAQDGVVAVTPASVPAAPAEATGRTPDALGNLAGDLHLRGMTFVGSRGDVTEFVLRAREALFRPDTNIAELEDVHVNGSESVPEERFVVQCARGELNVETSDFYAEGDVLGTTHDGKIYRAPWVRYDHEEALLFSDAPVTLEEPDGTFRGDGFRYHIKDRNFRLLGNVSMVQTP